MFPGALSCDKECACLATLEVCPEFAYDSNSDNDSNNDDKIDDDDNTDSDEIDDNDNTDSNDDNNNDINVCENDANAMNTATDTTIV